MTRADAWILFAAAALNSDVDTTIDDASSTATDMLAEFDQKFIAAGTNDRDHFVEKPTDMKES
jgi:hypothetical protein